MHPHEAWSGGLYSPHFAAAGARYAHTHYPMRTLRIVAILLLGVALALAIAENREPSSTEVLAPATAP